MKNYIMKYLVLKMCLGYGSTATEEEIDASIEYLKENNIEVDKSYDKEYVVKKDNIYYALYSLGSNIQSPHNFNPTLVDYMINNHKEENNKKIDLDEDIKTRIENLSIYLIIALSEIKKLSNNGRKKKYSLEDIESFRIIDDEYIELFDKLTSSISKIYIENLNKELEDEVELKIVNVDPRLAYTSYKAFCNFRIIDKECGYVFSKVFKDTCGFAMVFGTDTYYNMPSITNDFFFICKDYNNEKPMTMYGPIYNCVETAPDFIKNKEHDSKYAQELINKLLRKTK